MSKRLKRSLKLWKTIFLSSCSWNGNSSLYPTPPPPAPVLQLEWKFFFIPPPPPPQTVFGGRGIPFSRCPSVFHYVLVFVWSTLKALLIDTSCLIWYHKYESRRVFRKKKLFIYQYIYSAYIFMKFLSKNVWSNHEKITRSLIILLYFVIQSSLSNDFVSRQMKTLIRLRMQDDLSFHASAGRTLVSRGYGIRGVLLLIYIFPLKIIVHQCSQLQIRRFSTKMYWCFLISAPTYVVDTH